MTSEHEKIDRYLDYVAAFIVKHVPDYTKLPLDSQHVLEEIWIKIAVNRAEFTKVMDSLKTPRKKRVDKLMT